MVLVLRYKELSGGGGGGTGDDVPYDLVGYITEIDTGLIDADYMNSRFEKYLKLLNLEGASAEAVEQAETELHKTFATLSQEEQKYANIFLHDIQRGDVAITEGKTLRDYITEYLGQFTRNYTQTVKRAADNKRRYAPGWVHSTCLLRGFPKGAAPHLAHDFAEQSVVCYTLCRRCPENTVAAGEGKGI